MQVSYIFLCSPGDHDHDHDDHWQRVIKSLTEPTFFFDLVHRLTATLAFLIRLSPFYEDQLVPLLSVLQVGETLKGKLADDGKLKVRKKEIRALVGEVADRLCSV